MRSRSWLWVLLVAALTGWIGWSRIEIAEQREKLEVLRQDIERIDELQKYLPAMVRAEMARHERRMLVYWEGRDDRREEGVRKSGD